MTRSRFLNGRNKLNLPYNKSENMKMLNVKTISVIKILIFQKKKNHKKVVLISSANGRITKATFSLHIFVFPL